VLCLLLLRRYFDLADMLRAPIDRELAARLLLTGAALFPSNLARRTLIHGPALALNLLLPGGQGAAAAGLFEVARRIATVPYLVRQSFEYVLAPLSAEKAGSPRADVSRLYGLATRMTCALVLPLSVFLIFAARDVLSIYRPEVMAALPLLIILVVGRTCDAVAGPAQTVVEMTGNRALPVLNNALGVAVWFALMIWLVPAVGGAGMAVAVASATAVTAWAAVLELRYLTESGAMRRLWRCLVIACAAGGAMAAIDTLSIAPIRLAALVTVWLSASWMSLRWALDRQDKLALGGLAARLRI
jgi:O-antigen/teichoic acid export membrane protein